MNNRSTAEVERYRTKVLWYSDTPTCASGFGQVARNLLRVLSATGEYDFTVLGVNQFDYYDQSEYPAETEEESDVPATAFLGSTQTQGGLAVHFGVAIGGPVTLTMYDVMGRAVRRLQGDDEFGPGRYVRTWDGVDDTGQRVAAGVYLARLQTAAGVLTHKAVLIR